MKPWGWGDEDEPAAAIGSNRPSWGDFVERYLLWPTVVQVAILIALLPASWAWDRWRCSDIRLLREHIGKKHQKPANPNLLAALLVAQLVCSMVSVSLWVRRTYVQRCDDLLAEFWVAVFFVLGYLVRLMKNEFAPREALTLACVIDVYTTVPIFMERNESLWASLVFVRVFRALDAMAQIESTGVLDMLSDFRRALLFLVLRTICMVIVLSGTVFTLEILGDIPGFTDRSIDTGMGDISFVSIMYFSISTISTVGYGDFTPSTIPSRIFICLEIVVGVLFFSVETTNILELKNLLNTGKGSYRVRQRTKHVLVIGGGVRNVGEVLGALLKEIFGDYQKFEPPGWPDVVMMCPGQMDRSLEEQLKNMSPEKRRRVFYFVGSPMLSQDLERVALRDACMCYVLADVSAKDKSQEDGFNLLRALSVRKFNPEIRLRLMVLRPEFKERAVNAGIDGEHCFSVDETKATFLAHCCRCPGFITVISNLTDSEHVPESKWGHEQWMHEYFEGSNNAIYGMLVADRFAGSTWSELTLILFQEVGAILLAAQVHGRVVLNPAYVTRDPLLGGEVVFVVAHNPNQIKPVRMEQDWLVIFNARKKRASGWIQEERNCRGSLASDAEAFADFDRMAFVCATPSTNSRKTSRDSFASIRSSMGGSMGCGEPRLSSCGGLPVMAMRSQRRGKSISREARLGIEGLREKLRKVRTMVSSEGGHIVLISCGSDRGVPWNEIALMMATLRTPLRTWEHRPVMVLAPEGPPKSLAEEYTDVSFYIGAASNVHDLEAVLVSKASVVVLLAGDAQEDILAELRDHNAVVIANTLDLLLDGSSKTFVMYELHTESSTKFVPCPLTGKRHNIIKSILPTRSGIFRTGPLIGPQPVKLETQFACGQVFSLSFLGEMLGREYYVPSTMELLQALVMPARRGQSSFPWLVPIPKQFAGKTYACLFEAWCQAEDCAIPLGLYRKLPEVTEQYGYVVTNPDANLKLYLEDHVYVLASGKWGRSMLAKTADSSAEAAQQSDSSAVPPTKIGLQQQQQQQPQLQHFVSFARSETVVEEDGYHFCSDSEGNANNSEAVERDGGGGSSTPAAAAVAASAVSSASTVVMDPELAPDSVSKALGLMTRELRTSEDRMRGQIENMQKDLRATESKLEGNLARIEDQLQRLVSAVAPGASPPPTVATPAAVAQELPSLAAAAAPAAARAAPAGAEEGGGSAAAAVGRMLRDPPAAAPPPPQDAPPQLPRLDGVLPGEPW